MKPPISPPGWASAPRRVRGTEPRGWGSGSHGGRQPRSFQNRAVRDARWLARWLRNESEKLEERAKDDGSKELYLVSTAVFSGEVMKLLVSSVLASWSYSPLEEHVKPTSTFQSVFNFLWYPAMALTAVPSNQ
eukprot:s38_g20.t1